MTNELTKDRLDKATAEAGLPKMEWHPADGHVGQQRPGWWWTAPLSQDAAAVQQIGKRLCAMDDGLEYVAAVLPQGAGVALAVGPIGGAR